MKEEYEDINQKLNNKKYEKMEKKRIKKEQKEIERKKYKPGSFRSIIQIIQEIVKGRKKIEIKKTFTKEDKLAYGLTAIITVVVLLVLWFLPFTNGFMREIFFFLK